MKNNSVVIILMGLIIVIPAVLCVIFVSSIINLKTDNLDNEVHNREVEDQDNEKFVKDNNRD